MDYGTLIRQAWQLTWRHRFLWGLGLFAASTVGSCSPNASWGGTGAQWQTGPEELERLSPDLERILRASGFWLTRNLDVIAVLAGMAFVLGLALLVVSLIAQGGMARATADLALDRPISPRQAWYVGLRLFWRNLGLWLLMGALALLVGLAVAVVFGLGIGVGQLIGDPARVILMILAGLLGLLLALAAIPIFLAVTVAMALAQRAIAVENVGPLAGLRIAFRLLRDHLGQAALLWLISFGLSLVAGVAITVGVLALLVPLGGLALVLFVITELSMTLFLYSGAALVALIAWVWFLGAIANTFFWNLWTLAYLHFTGRLGDEVR